MSGMKLGLAATIQEQAAKMKFNPLIVSDTRHGLFMHYPELAALGPVKEYHESEKDTTFANRAVKYMVWLYSSDSILNVKPLEPLKDRKFKAAHLSGYQTDPSTNMFSEKICNELFELKNDKFVLAILAYLKYQKKELWSEIVVTEEQHYEALALRLKRVSGSSKATLEAAELKKKLRLECKELVQDLKGYWDEFWEDHLDLKVIGEQLYKSIEDRARINKGTE